MSSSKSISCPCHWPKTVFFKIPEMLNIVDAKIVTRSLICHENVKSHSKSFMKLHYKKSNSYKGLLWCKMFPFSEARHSRRMCYLPLWIKRDGCILFLCVCVPEVSRSTSPSVLSVSNINFTGANCCKIAWSYQQWAIVQGRYKSPVRALTSRHTQGQAVSGDPGYVMRGQAMSVAGFITVSWCLYSLAHAETGISLSGVWTVSDDDRGELMTFFQESKVAAVWELAHENYDWSRTIKLRVQMIVNRQ